MLPIAPQDPFSLFLDVDGTVLDIASRPDGVLVSPALREALDKLSDHLDGALALVSGRSIADLDGLFAPLRLRASGVHGAEMRFDPQHEAEISAEHLLPEGAVAVLRGIAGRYPGTLVENKRFSVAVHYRANPAIGPKLQDDLASFLVTAQGEGCRILPGHMVFEIKRSGFDKGTAIAAFQARDPFQGRQPVFIGDDVTDLPGFDCVLALGGLAFSVTTPRPGLSGHFLDPGAVRTWLSELANLTA